jgi:hypothetical protein
MRRELLISADRKLNKNMLKMKYYRAGKWGFNSIYFYLSTNKSIHGQHNEKNYIDGEKGHLQN